MSNEIKRQFLLKVATFEKILSEYKESLIKMIDEDNLHYIQVSMPERNSKELRAKEKAISDFNERTAAKIKNCQEHNTEFYHGLKLANKGSETVDVEYIIQNMHDLHSDLNNLILRVCSASSKIENGTIFAALFEECTEAESQVKIGEKFYIIHHEKD